MASLNPDSNSNLKLTIEQQLELDRVCNQFESQWQQQPDEPPQLLTWLNRLPPTLSQALFRELLLIEIDCRQSHSIPVTRDYLQTLYPDHKYDIDYVLQVITDRDLPTVDNTSQSLAASLATRELEHLRDFIKSLEQAPASDLTPQIANWTQEQLSRARILEQTWLNSNLTLPGSSSTAVQKKPLQQLGDFRIIREIGRGGMGTVFEAEQLSLRRHVALKVLWLGGRQNEESIQRFEREATTIANLHHTNIVPIFAVGEQDGINYYAMQLIDGESLDCWMKASAKQTCDLEKVVDWAVQAADALAHAHERGVVHRDVKPSNLMIDASGRLWLTDFGLAKRDQDQSLSLAGAMLGTPRYMSPEQASSNLQNVDHRSDIYSLGATLYELLARRPVFDGNSPYVLVQQILNEEPTSVDRVGPHIPRDLSTIVMKCLCKNPRDRYAAAKDLLADLRSVQEGRPIQARRAGVIDIAGKWVRRHQQTVRTTVLATAVLLLISLGTLLTWITVRQYYTTKLKLKLGSTPATVEFLNARGAIAHPPVASPTTEPLTLSSEPLTLRFQGKGYPSIDYRWLAEPQATEVFHVELQNQDWVYPRQPRLDYKIVGEGSKRLIVSWTDERLYVDVPGNLLAQPLIQEPSEGFELSKLSDQTQVAWVASLGSDLDGDGVDEVLVALARQSVIHLVSRKSGRLWVQDFAPNSEAALHLDQPIRGGVLQLPDLVPDQDGDGKQDLLMTIGQNSLHTPADLTKTTRSVVLISATGKLLWRHDLDASLFQLPQGAVVARALQWQLTDAYTTGVMNLSNFVVRNGRRIRELHRQPIYEAPHVEAPQAKWLLEAGRNQVLIRTGTKLQSIDLASGEAVMPPHETGVVSAVPLMCRDFDNDGKTEVMLIESLPPVTNTVPGSAVRSIPKTRLVLWSLQNQAAVWETTVDSKPPAYSAKTLTNMAPHDSSDAASGHRWPVVINDPKQEAAWLVLPWSIPTEVGYSRLESMPRSELAMIDAKTGKVNWNCQVPNMDCWTDHIAVLPDINQDGMPDVAIASLWGEPFEWIVECRSGRDGHLIWLQHQKIDESQFDEVASLSFLPSMDRVQLTLRNVENNQSVFQMQPKSGDVVQTLRDFEKLEFLDFDGDEVEDWCITQTEFVAGLPRKHLQIVKGIFRDRWRHLGSPVQVASDFDLDGINDLLSVKKDEIQAFSARSGELLWRYQPPTVWSECRASTWESECKRIIAAGQQVDSCGVASQKAWDVDGDGIRDLVLQAVTSQYGRSAPAIWVLSGKNGKLLWQSPSKLGHHEAMPGLTIGDFDEDNRLDILAIEWLYSGTRSGKNVSLTRWEVGSEAPLWTIPIESPNSQSVIARWNKEAELPDFPRPAFVEIDRDGVVDLALVIEPQSSDEDPQLMIGAISGQDGRVVWTQPLGIRHYDQQTIANSERYLTVDVDGDKIDELIVLSYVNRKGRDESTESIARLRAIDVTTGNPKWQMEHQVDPDFLYANNTRLTKPIGGRGNAGQKWITMPLRTRDQRDVVVVVDSQGVILDSYELKLEKPNLHGPVPCWVLDLDDDKQDEILFDDGEGLVALQVGDKLQLKRRFPIRARERDAEVSLVELNDNKQQLVVTNHSSYQATAFDLTTGQPTWRVVGPQSQKQLETQWPAVQFVGKAVSGQSVPGFDAPWVVFNGYRRSTTMQIATPNPSFVQSLQGMESQTNSARTTAPKDFRLKRPLPWADPFSQLFSTTSQLVTFVGFILLSSGLLIWLPYAVWRCMRRGWVSHLGALLLFFLIAAIDSLFLSQTFTMPFLLERPEWHDKLSVAFLFAPLWVVLYVVPQWIWQGVWRRALLWVLLAIVLSAAWGGWAILHDKIEAPFSQGESYALSWSPALLTFGVISASWLGSLLWGGCMLLRGLTKLWVKHGV